MNLFIHQNLFNMRRITVFLIVVSGIFLSCTKDCPKQENTKPDLMGTWIGKWGDEFQAQNNNYRIQIMSNGVANINNGFADYTGTWRIDDYTFVANYIVSGQSLTMKAPIDKSHMEGIWRNVTTNAYKGTFYLDKQ